MNLNSLFPPHAFRYQSGGGGGASAPVLPAPPAPQATASSVEVTQAKLLARQQARAKQGIGSTMLAGALGDSAAGGPSTQAPTRGNVLLGGGISDFGYLGL